MVAAFLWNKGARREQVAGDGRACLGPCVWTRGMARRLNDSGGDRGRSRFVWMRREFIRFRAVNAGGFMRKSIHVAAFAFCAMSGGAFSAAAHAETRVISMHHVHTNERITIAYWKDGRFIPSALKKLNWFLRDWRKNRAVRMDPRTIDLIWKLHEDLGSKKPVEIICGHRSAATNAMLRRIGRKVARRSRHITGQAIDFRFPDVPNWKVRNLALAYGIGGVGYYGRGGFIHADTGSVRHWPRLPARKYASIVRQYRSYIGYRNRRPGTFMLAAARMKGGKAAITNIGHKGRKPVIVASARRPVRAAASGPVSLIGAVPGRRQALAALLTPPKPRARPYQVLLQAAATMEIAPVSAPATITNFANRGGHDQIGMIISSTALEDPALSADGASGRSYPRVNRSGKGDLAADIRSGRAAGVPLIRPLLAAAKGDALLGTTPDALMRRNGAPLPLTAAADPADPQLKAAAASMLPLPGRHHGVVKAQRVNRSGKGDLLTRRPLASLGRQARLDPSLDAFVRPLTFRSSD